jgi:hypothetical protein
VGCGLWETGQWNMPLLGKKKKKFEKKTQFWEVFVIIQTGINYSQILHSNKKRKRDKFAKSKIKNQKSKIKILVSAMPRMVSGES